MTNAQLKTLLRWAMRYVANENARLRACYTNPVSKRIHWRGVALDVAKADIWLAKARKAVAKTKTR